MLVLIMLLFVQAQAFNKLNSKSYRSISSISNIKQFKLYAGKSTEKKAKISTSIDKGTPPSSDPWKVLIRKLDTTKTPKVSVGKIEKVENIIDELQCPHFGTCSGCTIKGNFFDSPVIRRCKSFFQTYNTNVKIHLSNITEWRTHVKLAVQPMSRWGGLKFGLYKMKSHIVEPIPDCKVHHPKINYAMEELRVAALDAGVLGYQEGTEKLAPQGELRYIQMSLERFTGKIQLVLVWNALTFKDASPSLTRLIKKLKSNPSLWHSITVNFQISESNVIFNYNPKAWKLMWGPPTIKEKIGNVTFYMRPQIFRQSNLDAFENGIIPLVVKNILPGTQVAELYSGIGVLGLNAVSKAEEVLCSDNNVYVDEVFDLCADTLPDDKKEKVFFECLTAEDSIEQGQVEDAEVLIVDPPRKGLDPDVMALLINTHETAKAPNLKRLIYVSCGYDALERDTRQLLDSNRWKIKSVDGFILFPGTDHIETVVIYDRK